MYRIIDMRLSDSGSCSLHEISSHKHFSAALNKARYHYREGRRVLLILGDKFNGGNYGGHYVVFSKKDADLAYTFYHEIGVPFVDVYTFLSVAENSEKYVISHSSCELNSETGHYEEFGGEPLLHRGEDVSYVVEEITRKFDSE